MQDILTSVASLGGGKGEDEGEDMAFVSLPSEPSGKSSNDSSDSSYSSGRSPRGVPFNPIKTF